MSASGRLIGALGTLADLANALIVSQVPSTPGVAAPAANTAAVVTFVGVAGQRIRLTHLSWSVSATPVAATTLTVADGTTTLTYDVLAVAPGTEPVTNLQLPTGGILFAVGATVTITLGALGAAVSGRVNAARIIG